MMDLSFKFTNITAEWKKHRLEFKQASGTSRGVLKYKDSYFILIKEKDGPIGIGECGLLKGLSADDRPDYETKLTEVCSKINEYEFWLDSGLKEFPSIHFGLEMALLDLTKEGSKILFPSPFTENKKELDINGLIWMGNMGFMFEQIDEKINKGFNCIKMKIGAIDFKQEFDLLRNIRAKYTKEEMIIRVDANGGFKYCHTPYILEQLAKLDIHSIEQPIKTKQWKEMADLCKTSPIPIALDEELIGVFDREKKEQLLDLLQPPYVIFKPSFIGGFKGTTEWINLCKERNIDWWMTSALESNIGLNAIAQWTATLDNPLHQGLGTGQLYTNNIPSPLYVEKGKIGYKPDDKWDLSLVINP